MKYLKKWISFLVAFSMVLGMIPGTVLAEGSILASGTCGAQGDNLTWTLTDDGVLTVTGSGAMADYPLNNTPWSSYQNDIIHVRFGENLVYIGESAFFACQSMQSVTIPEGVTEIGDYAFADCRALSHVTLPSTLQKLGIYSFRECGLTEVTIPANVSSIGEQALTRNQKMTWIYVDENNQFFTSQDGVLFSKDMTKLVTYPAGRSGEYVVPDGVQIVGESAFDLSKGLTQVEFSSSVTEIGSYCFLNCNALSRVVFRGDAPTIRNGAFYSSTATIYVPQGNPTWTEEVMQDYGGTLTWETYDPSAVEDFFAWNLSDDGVLTLSGLGDMPEYSWNDVPWYEQRLDIISVVMEEGLTTISPYAFYKCSNLTSVQLPQSLRTIGFRAFYDCAKLADISIPEGVTSIGSQAFHLCYDLTSLTLPSTLQELQSMSLAATGLEQLHIPASVTSIAPDALDANFSIEQFTVESGNSHYSALDGVLFNIDQTELIAFPGARSGSYDIPQGVEHIGGYAFASSRNLNAISIPDGVTSIGEYSFSGCVTMESWTIPATVTTIGKLAFADNYEVTSVMFRGQAPAMGEDAFRYVEATVYIPQDDPTWTEEVKQNYGGTLTWVETDTSNLVAMGECGQAVSWRLTNDGVLTISGTGAMDDFAFPGNQETRPWGAYMDQITAVVVEDGVTSVGNTAFYHASQVTSVTLADSVKTIGDSAFRGCQNLSSLVLGNGLERIGQDTFGGAYALNTLVLPQSLVTIDSGAFNSCTGLTELTFPAGIETIGSTAFYDSTSINRMEFLGRTPPQIGSAAFHGITAQVYYPKDGSWTSDVMQSYEGTLTWRFVDEATGETGGFCGEQVYWVHSGTTLYIRGTGAMADSALDLGEYNTTITTVIVEEGVTTIGNSAFQKLSNLSSVTLPDSLQSIGASAFHGLQALEHVQLPQNLKTIGDAAFGESGICSITIPASIETLGAASFNGCQNLTEIILEDGVQGYCVVDNVLFTADMTTLITYPAGKAGAYAIPEGVVTIADHAFYQARELTDVEIPDSVQNIGMWAFCYCVKLTVVSLPGGLVNPGFITFGDCTNISSVIFRGNAPQQIAPMFVWTASGNSSGINVFYPAGDETWTEEVISSLVYEIPYSYFPYEPLGNGASGQLSDTISWAVDAQGNLTISGTGAMPELTSAPPYLSYYPHIRKVVVEDGITAIAPGAFGFVPNLTEVTIAGSVVQIGQQAFYGCGLLEAVELSEGLKVIDPSAFANDIRLEQLRIPATVSFIGEYAFAGCPALNDITFQSGTPYLSTNALQDSGANAGTITVHYPSNHPTWYTEVRENMGNYGAVDIEWVGYELDSWPMAGHFGKFVSWTLTEDGTMTVSGSGEMFDYNFGYPPPQFLYGLPDAKEIIIEEGVTTVGMMAFMGCSEVSQVQLPSSLVSIKIGAFATMTKLTTVTIPAGVTQLEEQIFNGCTGLTEVIFLGDAPAFRDSTFDGNTFTAVYPAGNDTWTADVMQQYGGTITWVMAEPVVIDSGSMENGDQWTFDSEGTLTIEPGETQPLAPQSRIWQSQTAAIGSASLTTRAVETQVPWQTYKGDIQKVVVISGVTEVVENAFSGCDKLEEVELAPTVTTIGAAAFQDCTALTQVTIPENVQTIESQAFSGCQALENVEFQGDAPETGSDVFAGVSQDTTITYPQDNATWTEDKKETVSGGTVAVVPGMKLSGTVTTYHNDADSVTIELLDSEGAVVYSQTVFGNQADYTITGVHASTYTLRISKQNHVTRSYALTVEQSNLIVDGTVYLKGDLNYDGNVDVGDYSTLLGYVKNSDAINTDYKRLCADLNGDGTINVGDYSTLLGHVKGTMSLWK